MSLQLADGSISVPGEDLVSDLYLETIDFLAVNGYQQYEISNFARPGFSCRHNLKYWMRQPVLGFGAAAGFDASLSAISDKACTHSRERVSGSTDAGQSPERIGVDYRTGQNQAG
jgi:coproporphyrinogen III oxidase-like Fe-S oxidoreductase